MKKLLLTAVGCVVALASYGQAASALYITGNMTSPSWNAAQAQTMTKAADSDTYTYTFSEGTPQFKISTVKADWDAGFNSNCLGLYSGNQDVPSSDLNKKLKLTKGWTGNTQLPLKDTYTITVTYESGSYYMTISTPGGEVAPYTPPAQVYIKGGVNNWQGGDAYALKLQNQQPDSQGNYVFSGTIASLSGEFKICESLGSSWDGINYGVGTGNTATVIETNKKVACTNNGANISLGSQTYNNVTVTFTFNLEGTSYIQVDSDEAPSYPQTLYVIGNVLNQSWSPSKGVALSTTDGGQTFSGEVDLTSSPSYFSFAEKLSPASDPSNWDAGPNTGVRYAPSEDTAATADGKSMVLPTGNASSASWSIAGGTYNINVNIKDGTFSMTPVVKTVTALSLLGQFNDNGSVSEDWNTGKTMTAGADNKTYTISDVKMMGKDGATDAYFRFKTGDGLQYGPETEVEASLTAANPLVQTSDKAYYLKNGTYSFTVNVEDWTFTVTGTPDEVPGTGDVASEVTIDFTSYDNLKTYYPNLPDYSSWTASSSNYYYTFEDLTFTTNGVTFNANKGTVTTPANYPRFYYYGGSYDFRMSKGSTFTISAPKGYQLEKIEIKGSSIASNTNAASLAIGQPGTTTAASGNQGTLTWTAPVDESVTSLNFEITGSTFRDGTIKVTLSATTNDALTLYVVGDDINGSELWAVGTDNVMTYNEADGTYTWSGTKLGGKFKIFDGDWEGDYNIGAPANAAAIELGTPFTVQKGNYPENIFLAENTYIENPEIVLDLEKLTVTLTGTVVNTAPYVPDYITLKGSFDEWGDGVKLEKTEDGTYVGIGVIPASTNQYKYVELKLDAGNNQWYGPADNQYDITLTSDEPTTVDMNVKAEGNWYLQNWDEEGEITFTVDWDAKTLTLLYEAKVADVWYIRGKFNDYNPADNSEWALNPVEDENGVYSGTFTVDSGEFSFNLLAPNGYVFIPGIGETVEIEFTNGKYNGSMYDADETEESVYWEFPDWTGGEFTVTIDSNEGTITIETDAKHDTDAVNALYRFTEDDAIYNLQGVKISNPVKGQIYIINGKKAILK